MTPTLQMPLSDKQKASLAKYRARVKADPELLAKKRAVARKYRQQPDKKAAHLANYHKVKGEAKIQQRYNKYKYDATKIRMIPWELTETEAKSILREPCHYCGIADAHGIDRKNNTDAYSVSNCLPCCTQCNMSKRTASYEEHMQYLMRIHVFMTSKLTTVRLPK